MIVIIMSFLHSQNAQKCNWLGFTVIPTQWRGYSVPRWFQVVYTVYVWFQRHSVGYRRPRRTAILPPTNVVRCMMLPYHPILPLSPPFCRPGRCAPLYTPVSGAALRVGIGKYGYKAEEGKGEQSLARQLECCMEKRIVYTVYVCSYRG